VRAFGDQLAARLGLPVEYCDERLSTVEAQRRLAPPTGRAGPKKASRSAKGRQAARGRLDALAAAIILQSYLDRRAGGGPPPPAQG